MKIFKTTNICAKEIGIKLENNIITNIKFFGGCDGNTKGLENLLLGMNKNDVIKKLKNINCRNKGTSCPDQLAMILENL